MFLHFNHFNGNFHAHHKALFGLIVSLIEFGKMSVSIPY